MQTTKDSWDAWCRMCVSIHHRYPVHSESDLHELARLKYGVSLVGERVVFDNDRLRTLWLLEFGG